MESPQDLAIKGFSVIIYIINGAQAHLGVWHG